MKIVFSNLKWKFSQVIYTFTKMHWLRIFQNFMQYFAIFSSYPSAIWLLEFTLAPFFEMWGNLQNHVVCRICEGWVFFTELRCWLVATFNPFKPNQLFRKNSSVDFWEAISLSNKCNFFKSAGVLLGHSCPVGSRRIKAQFQVPGSISRQIWFREKYFYV